MSSVPPLESPPKAICFDLDGTLLDSLVDLADSMNAALREFGHPEYPTRAYRYFVGNGARALVTRTLPEVHRDPETIEVVFQRYQAIYPQTGTIKPARIRASRNCWMRCKPVTCPSPSSPTSLTPPRLCVLRKY